MSNNREIITGRALARRHNISEAAIRNAYQRDQMFRIKSGKHVGKYDMSDERNVKGLELILSNSQSGDKRPRTKEQKEKTKKKREINKQKKQQLLEEDLTQEGIEYLDSIVDIGNLRVLKEREAIREKQLKNREMRGELVDRKNVSFVFNKLWSIDSSQLTTLGSKLSPEIASICSVDDPIIITKIRTKIDDEIYKTLGHCQRLLMECLGKIGADNLEEE